MEKKIEVYTGGYFQTNAFVVTAPEGLLLIDAPEGCLDWLRDRGSRIAALLLTHAHIDHIQDAAAIAREYGCPIYHHPDGLPLLLDRSAYRRFGLSIDFEPVTGGLPIHETPRAEFAGQAFQLFHVPGHCPGSLCFYDAPGKLLYAGDTLFAGSIGRTDLPGGDHRALIENIRAKLLTLDDDVRVLPGHGPATTIGVERATNPFLR
jgi:hydroxyacylglutathione hydrolase